MTNSQVLLVKNTVEKVPAAHSESALYSCYVLTPKKDDGLRPILDLRFMNCTHLPRGLFLSRDLKDSYFHIQIAHCHRPLCVCVCVFQFKSYFNNNLKLKFTITIL